MPAKPAVWLPKRIYLQRRSCCRPAHDPARRSGHDKWQQQHQLTCYISVPYTHTHRQTSGAHKQKYIFGYYKLIPGELCAFKWSRMRRNKNNKKKTTFYKAIEIGLLCEMDRQTGRQTYWQTGRQRERQKKVTLFLILKLKICGKFSSSFTSTRNYFGINFLICVTSWQSKLVEKWPTIPISPHTPFQPLFCPLPAAAHFALATGIFRFIWFRFIWFGFHFELVILTNENNIWYAKHMWRDRTNPPAPALPQRHCQ